MGEEQEDLWKANKKARKLNARVKGAHLFADSATSGVGVAVRC